MGNPNPTTGEVYYVALAYTPSSKSVSYPNCLSHQLVSMELALPQNTTLAISQANPIQCYSNGVLQSTCPSTYNTGSGPAGSGETTDTGFLRFDPSNGAQVWQVDDGEDFEVHVPVVSSAAFSQPQNTACPLTGQGCVVGRVRVWDGFQDSNTAPWTFSPQVGVTVTQAASAPTVGYQNPATSNITQTGASLNYTYNPNGNGGSRYAQVGKAGSGGSCTSPTNIATAGSSVSLASGDSSSHNASATASGLTAGTAYCWRAVFAPTSGSTVNGAWKPFTTSPPKYKLTVTNTDSSAYIVSDVGGINCGSSQGVNSKCNASYDAGTVVTLEPVNSVFISFLGWSGACTGTSPTGCKVTMDGNKSVTASFGVAKHNSTTTLVSSKNPAPTGDAVKYTATVSPAGPSTVAPTGTVQFTEGGNAIPGCSAIPRVNGTASCTTVYFRPGTRSIGAVYSGDTNFNGSSSTALSEAITQGPPDTTITSGLPAGVSTTGRTPAFAFSSPNPGATFECSLDGGTFAACTSPYTTPLLSFAQHTFAVRAVLGNLVDASPAERTFTVVKVTSALTALEHLTNGKDVVTGQLTPTRSGEPIVVVLQRKKNGVFGRVASKSVNLTALGKYGASFSRPAAGTCRAKATYAGDAGTKPSSATTAPFSC